MRIVGTDALVALAGGQSTVYRTIDGFESVSAVQASDEQGSSAAYS